MKINRRQFIQRTTALAPAAFLPVKLFAQEGLRGRWQRLTDLPFPVQEIYPTVLNNKIHVAGGFIVLPNNWRGPTAMHFQYSIADNQWRQLQALPEERHHPNLVACNNAIYALGGFKPEAAGSWVMKNQTWKYQADVDKWEILKPAPEVHGETVCLALGNDIHVVGGRHPGGENLSWIHHQDVDRHLVFDTHSQTWRSAAPALSVRNSAAGAVINNQLYVVGGRTVNGGNVGTLEIYDPQEDKWRDATPMPQAQGGLGAAAIDNQLIAFGGEFFGAGGRGVYAETWRYDSRTDQWHPAAPMLTPRHGLGAVSDGKQIYAIAGATEAGGNGTSAALESFQF